MIEVQTFSLGALGTNCHILYDADGQAVIVDCDGSGREVEAFVQQRQLCVRLIALTHGHFDHIGAVQTLRERYACPVCIGEKETALLASPALNLSEAMAMRPLSLTADRTVADGDAFDVGQMHWQVLHTPGHTAGSVCYVVDRFLVAGDTLFAGSCGRTDFPTGDPKAMRASLQRLAAFTGDYTVLPGHGSATTLHWERAHNPFMQE